MANTPNPTNPTPQGTTPVKNDDQNLDIHLDEAPKTDISIPEETKKTEADLDLNLDINLEDAPESKDRLKKEDSINQEETKKIEMPKEAPVEIKPAAIEKTANPFAPEIAMPEIPTIEEDFPKINESPMVEEKRTTEEMPKINETTEVEEIPTIQETPSSTIEEIPSSPETPTKEDIIEPKTLKEDMKIIDELETQASAGGLDQEAKVDTTPVTEETPKTFDLDAMLGTTTPAVEQTPIGENSPKINETATPEETTSDLFKVKPEETTAVEQAPVVENSPAPEVNPTPTTTLPPQNESIYNTTATQKTPQQDKNKSVKILLFVVLFAVLWFITYFILKTMYPVELENMFGGNTIENTEEITGEVEELTGTVEEMTGTMEELTWEATTETIENTIPEAGTGDHESAVDFWELNDLWSTETVPAATDISRLTDYVNKGNELREIGKELNNNTIIKFALYTKTKATSFLEKIAKGEEISNLDSYFAQFDQYISQIEALIDAPTTTTEEVSPLPENNATEETTTEPEAMTNEF